MIVDHVVTRSAVRSLAMVCAAVVPLASAYFLYMLAYNESPVDTIIHQAPIVLQLLRSNRLSASAHGLPPLPASARALSPPSSSSPLFGMQQRQLQQLHHSIDSSEPYQLSPAMNGILAIASYLESRGYSSNHVYAFSDLPGSQYLAAFQPPKAILDPVLVFISSHQTLAWIVSLVHLWMATELIFYVYFWKRLSQVQEIDRVVKGPRTQQERQELFQRCLETVGNDSESVKRWVETWFDTGRTHRPVKFSDIGRSNMMHWLAWAFWAAPLDEVFRSTADLVEMNDMIDSIEANKGIQFAHGYNPDVDCIRLSLDPVVASHRPLIYYAVSFTRYENSTSAYDTFPSEGKRGRQELAKEASPTDLAYWYRTPTGPENKVPLVFIHGIGIGLAQYIHWIVALTTISRPLILIEVPYVSNRLLKTDCMTPDETYFSIERILRAHGHNKASFLGHSLGTMLCAAISRASSATSAKSIIAGLILVDPICFLTHHSIARNFAYRTPTKASELVMDLFAAREIGTSWYIMRRFCWNQCIVFPRAWRRRMDSPMFLQGRLSPVFPKKTRVFLSRKDNLLDMDNIAAYLRTKVGLREDRGELVVMDGMDHAQFLLHPGWFLKALKAAEEC
ncbi:hypothetical protein BGW38_001330 [Lunasporangiospora selenospora]|uniref:AB hydrolase-1 domain-containing protein n=1 Tax=Lunasporangiospora selenospora TaxID=979761 RepID=A0A9P6FVS1_9FUNG|nr:hypothetical protein BGW38_001330 [Lunasporangiospora selenospora]